MYITAKDKSKDIVIVDFDKIYKIKLDVISCGSRQIEIDIKFFTSEEVFSSVTMLCYEFEEGSILDCICESFLDEYIHGMFIMMMNDYKKHPVSMLEPETTLVTYLDNQEIGKSVRDAMNLY